MTVFCKHHLNEAAHWECPNCDSFYCDCCITKRQGGYGGKETFHFCPSCNRPAEWIAATNVVRPFWEMLQSFFVYPFTNMFTVIFMVGISIACAVFAGKGLLGNLALLAVFILTMKYSFAAMAATARGALVPPAVDLKSLSENAQQAFVPGFLTILIFFLCGIVGAKTGPAGAVLFLIAGFLCLPAMIMSYMAGGGIIHAVNPALFIRIITRIGGAYFSMVFFLVLLLSAPNALSYAVGRFLPPSLQTVLLTFVNCYYSIVFYHLMGYVLLQYHREIGYTVDREDFIFQPGGKSAAPAAPVRNDPASQLLERIGFLAREGKYDEALVLVKNETKGRIDSPQLSAQYYKLLKMRNDPGLKDHLEPHVKMMISANDKKEACDAFMTALSQKTDMDLPPQSLIKLAGWLNETGAHRESVSTYNRIISGKADAPHLVPMAYFRAACVLYEKLNDKEKAGKIFRMLKSKYPMDDIIPHVDNYLRRIEATQ
jgi:tetratricopeptide (TPR) repeat protein